MKLQNSNGEQVTNVNNNINFYGPVVNHHVSLRIEPDRIQPA